MSILEEDAVNVKNFATSRLPAHGSMEGMEVGGSVGHPAMPQLEFALSHAAEDGSTNDVEKVTLMSPKTEKGELSMGPMVTSGWKSKDCSGPATKSISLVGKSMGMPETPLGGFVP